MYKHLAYNLVDSILIELFWKVWLTIWYLHKWTCKYSLQVYYTCFIRKPIGYNVFRARSSSKPTYHNHLSDLFVAILYFFFLVNNMFCLKWKGLRGDLFISIKSINKHQCLWIEIYHRLDVLFCSYLEHIDKFNLIAT